VSELVYPQLAQLPIVRRMRRRTVVNRTADGRTMKLGDPAGEITEWELRYQELSDAEAAALQTFFESAEGALLPFTFVDPTANLLADSETLDGPAWRRDPLLEISGGPEVWQIANRGGAAQGIWQEVGGPGGFVYCLSLYARTAGAAIVTLGLGSARAEQTVRSDWRRLRMTGAADEAKFGVELGPGVSVDVRGLQVEAQQGASTARAGGSGGVFENAHFREDELEVVATGPNRHSCTVNIVHAIHI
jgi:hypothetical protein